VNYLRDVHRTGARVAVNRRRFSVHFFFTLPGENFWNE